VIKDYEEQRKQGLDPTFDPEKLGIQNAEAWEEKSEKQEYGVKKHQRVV
jgi:AGCS family alanine or glycine:cation symporter